MPELDSEVRSPCPDPGVAEDPRIATVQHRGGLAECERRRALAVEAYDGVAAYIGARGAAR